MIAAGRHMSAAGGVKIALPRATQSLCRSVEVIHIKTHIKTGKRAIVSFFNGDDSCIRQCSETAAESKVVTRLVHRVRDQTGSRSPAVYLVKATIRHRSRERLVGR